jgi:hypothetical protein
MSILGDYDKRECQKFLEKFGNWLDPTWGFYVYGTYTRPEGQKDADGGDG